MVSETLSVIRDINDPKASKLREGALVHSHLKEVYKSWRCLVKLMDAVNKFDYIFQPYGYDYEFDARFEINCRGQKKIAICKGFKFMQEHYSTIHGKQFPVTHSMSPKSPSSFKSTNINSKYLCLNELTLYRVRV